MGEEAGIENESRLYAGEDWSRLGKFRARGLWRLHHKIAISTTGNVMVVSRFNSTGCNDESISVDGMRSMSRF